MIKILYLIYQICFALPVMIAVTILVALTTMIGSVFNDRFWGYWPGMIWGRLFYAIFLIPIRIDGRENIVKGQSYVIAANHQSYWDAGQDTFRRLGMLYGRSYPDRTQLQGQVHGEHT